MCNTPSNLDDYFQSQLGATEDRLPPTFDLCKQLQTAVTLRQNGKGLQTIAVWFRNADRHSHCSQSLCSRGIDLTGCQLKIQIHYLFIYLFIITVSDYIHLNPFVLHSNNDGFRHGGPGHGGEQVGHSGWEGPQIEKEVSFYPKCHFTRTFLGGVSIVIVP